MTPRGMVFRHLKIGDVFLHSNGYLHRKVGPTTAVRLVELDVECRNDPGIDFVTNGDEREMISEIPVARVSTKKIFTAAA